jgi:predicted transcriptional regulator
MQASLRNQRRSSLDIVEEILSLCQKEQTKTAVVYKCNLNFKLISGYLQTLRDNGLLEEVKHDDRVVYKCTEKGSAVCREMSRVRELVPFMYPNLSE